MRIKERLCNLLSPNNRGMVERLKRNGQFNLFSILVILFVIVLIIVFILALDFVIVAGAIYLACMLFGLEFNWTGCLIMFAIYLLLNLILPENL